jgi:hypothetical protein
MAPHLVHQSEPGWQQRAVRGLEEANAQKNWMRNVHLRASWKFLSLVKLAARERGISTQGYIRRAISAFLVRDLGLAWEEIVDLCPRTTPFDQASPEAIQVRLDYQQAKKDGVLLCDDGKGYGDWNIWD